MLAIRSQIFEYLREKKITDMPWSHGHRLVQKTNKKMVTGWFKLNDGNTFPGQSPRRFFESDREILRLLSPYKDLT